MRDGSRTLGLLAADLDGDGHKEQACGGSDCDDTDANGDPIGSSYRLPRVFSVLIPDGDGDGFPDLFAASL